MRKIAKEHKHLPAAKRVEAAQAAFEAAAAALSAANRAAHAAGRKITEELQEKAIAIELAQKQLQEAEAEFDRAIGEPKPVALTGFVLEKLRETFAPQFQDEAIRALETGLTFHLPFVVTAAELERVRLAVIKVAAGDLEELRRQVNVAQIDWRDVINDAEYPEASSMSLTDYANLDEKDKHDITTRDRQQYISWLGEHKS